MAKRIIDIIALILLALLLVGLFGCANTYTRPWDPPPNRALFEQIPNWEGGADRVCCGSTYPDCKPYQSPRC